MKAFLYKHLPTIGLVAIMLLSMIGCRRGNTTRITTSDDHNSQTIEYAGRVVFSKDQRSIDDISKNGYLKFERNGKKLVAELGTDNKVAYKFDSDRPVSVLTAEEKQFLAEAIRTIINERKKLRADKI